MRVERYIYDLVRANVEARRAAGLLNRECEEALQHVQTKKVSDLPTNVDTEPRPRIREV